jgi:hypothetical protein
MTLLDLPDALHENILRFLSVHSPDHLSLAFTCRQLLQEVESFSKKELDRISREHDVDDDWLYRAGMQAVVAGQQKAGWYISSRQFLSDGCFGQRTERIYIPSERIHHKNGRAFFVEQCIQMGSECLVGGMGMREPLLLFSFGMFKPSAVSVPLWDTRDTQTPSPFLLEVPYHKRGKKKICVYGT